MKAVPTAQVKTLRSDELDKRYKRRDFETLDLMAISEDITSELYQWQQKTSPYVLAHQTTADGSLRVYVLKNIEEILTSAHRDRLWQFALISLTALLLSVLIGGGVWYVITTRRQQDKLIQLNKILDQQANTDMLTGIANRRHFMVLGEQELSRTIRYGGELSLLMMDIDYFKNVNDVHGHHVGDLVLQKLGDVCHETLRDIDTAGRIGGEEFAVLLPQTSNEQASEAAERLRAVISSSETPSEQGLPVHFTVSIGVTTLVDKSTNLDTLLSEADKALYEAKEQGRNKVCAWKN
jgi:diguanylate cyclase (GGDEF)-like protein